jgi:preprotein translocase subunit YajC
VNQLFANPLVLFAATTKKTSSSGSATFLIFIVVIIAAAYFLFLRPNQQKAKRAREENSKISVGDTVVTIGGIVGRVEAINNDRVTVVSGESDATNGPAPTRLVMLRSAISRKEQSAVSEPEVEDETPAIEAGSHDDETHDDESSNGSGGSSWWPRAKKKAEGENSA